MLVVRVVVRAMGVPAFFKWLSTKYGKIFVDCVEERHTWSDAGARRREQGPHGRPAPHWPRLAEA